MCFANVSLNTSLRLFIVTALYNNIVVDTSVLLNTYTRVSDKHVAVSREKAHFVKCRIASRTRPRVDVSPRASARARANDRAKHSRPSFAHRAHRASSRASSRAMFHHAATGAFAPRRMPTPRDDARGNASARASNDAMQRISCDARVGSEGIVRRPTPRLGGKGATRDNPTWTRGEGFLDATRTRTRTRTRTDDARASDDAGPSALERELKAMQRGGSERDGGDASGREAERAFHSVHDLVHYAILSQPNALASLRMIYSICQRAGRIASKHGAGSRLITANEHWKSQIRHALYTSPRFKRIGSDDWGVAAGHSAMPDTTTVYVSKDERKNAEKTHAVSRASTVSSYSHKSLSSPKKRRLSTSASVKPASKADEYRSSTEPETVSMLALEGEKALKLLHSASGHSGSAQSALSMEDAVGAGSRTGRTMTKSPSPRQRSHSRSRSRSCSPEPRESSTLVVVAGLLEHEGKVLPRDFRRNRRKPFGGGHHAAMPADSECRVDQSPCPVTGLDSY